jgi:hypothetical protein
MIFQTQETQNAPSLSPRACCDNRANTVLFVGMEGFEPTTSPTRTARASGLRYIPMWRGLYRTLIALASEMGFCDRSKAGKNVVN